MVIPGREELTLQPGGVHIVLRGLKKALRPYDRFDLTLVFEKVGAVQAEVLVEEKTSTPSAEMKVRHARPRARDHVRRNRVARVSATEGTTSHCKRGDNPVPMSGSTGISGEYVQLCRTVVFNRSL